MAKFPFVNGKAEVLDLPEYKDIDIQLKEVCAPGEFHTRWVITNAKTGKVMKPKGWTQPDLFGVMEDIEMIYKMRNQPDKVATTALMEYFHHNEGRREKGEITL